MNDLPDDILKLIFTVILEHELRKQELRKEGEEEDEEDGEDDEAEAEDKVKDEINNKDEDKEDGDEDYVPGEEEADEEEDEEEGEDEGGEEEKRWKKNRWICVTETCHRWHRIALEVLRKIHVVQVTSFSPSSSLLYLEYDHHSPPPLFICPSLCSLSLSQTCKIGAPFVCISP